jgi:hypothetical protein
MIFAIAVFLTSLAAFLYLAIRAPDIEWMN